MLIAIAGGAHCLELAGQAEGVGKGALFSTRSTAHEKQWSKKLFKRKNEN